MDNPSHNHDTIIPRDLGVSQENPYFNVIQILGWALREESSLDRILWRITDTAIAELGFVDCIIYLVDDSGTVLNQRAAYGPKGHAGRFIIDPIAIPIGEGIVGTVAATGRAVIISDTRQDPRYLVDDGPRLSELAVPIVGEGRVLGVIDSEHPELDFYTPEHLEAVTAIAALVSGQIASAILARPAREQPIEAPTSVSVPSPAGMERVQSLYEQLPSMLMTIDSRGIIRDLNQATTETLGWTIDEVMGVRLISLHVDGTAATAAIRRCVKRPDQAHHWSAELRDIDGHHHRVQLIARAVDLPGQHGKSILVAIQPWIEAPYPVPQAAIGAEVVLPEASIPTDRPVMGQDLSVLPQRLQCSTNRCCRLLGITITTWSDLKNRPDEPIRNATVALLVRLLDHFPFLAGDTASLEDLRNQVEQAAGVGISLSELSLLLGKDRAAASRWGNDYAKPTEATTSLIDKLVKLLRQHPNAYPQFRRVVEQEAAARGIPYIWGAHSWKSKRKLFP